MSELKQSPWVRMMPLELSPGFVAVSGQQDAVSFLPENLDDPPDGDRVDGPSASANSGRRSSTAGG